MDGIEDGLVESDEPLRERLSARATAHMESFYLRFSLGVSYGSSNIGIVTWTCERDLYMKCRSPGMPRLATEYSVSPCDMASESLFNRPSFASRCSMSSEWCERSRAENATHGGDSLAPRSDCLEVGVATDAYEADLCTTLRGDSDGLGLRARSVV